MISDKTRFFLVASAVSSLVGTPITVSAHGGGTDLHGNNNLHGHGLTLGPTGTCVGNVSNPVDSGVSARFNGHNLVLTDDGSLVSIEGAQIAGFKGFVKSISVTAKNAVGQTDGVFGNDLILVGHADCGSGTFAIHVEAGTGVPIGGGFINYSLSGANLDAAYDFHQVPTCPFTDLYIVNNANIPNTTIVSQIVINGQPVDHIFFHGGADICDFQDDGSF